MTDAQVIASEACTRRDVLASVEFAEIDQMQVNGQWYEAATVFADMAVVHRVPDVV